MYTIFTVEKVNVKPRCLKRVFFCFELTARIWSHMVRGLLSRNIRDEFVNQNHDQRIATELEFE